VDRQTIGNPTKEGKGKIVTDVLMFIAFCIGSLVMMAIAGQVHVARKKSEEANRESARIAEEERIAKMVRENPEGYRANREREIEQETRRREKAEQQKVMLDTMLTAGLKAANALMKKRR